MSLLHPDRSRSLPVRLCDLDPHVLRHAAMVAARHETDPAMIDQILHAAVCPSDHVFYIAADAEPLLRKYAA